MALTDIKIKSLKTESKAYKIFDGGGLFIYVTTTGNKKWRIKYRFEGKENTLSLGDYPLISLRDARAKLQEVKGMLLAGVNPNISSKKRTLVVGGTFKELALDWVSKQVLRWSAEHKENVIYRLERYVFPKIGTSKIDEITPQIVLTFLRPLEAQGKYETASRTLGICSQVFRFAVACGVCPSDPCRDLRGALTAHKETPRAALTKPSDVARLMSLIKNYGGDTLRNAMLWSAYTFCRPGEVRQAEWGEIDFHTKEWRIPAEKMKMRKEHRVPLSRQCMEVLENMKHRDEKWIFPSPRKGRCLSEAGVLTAIRAMGYEKHEMCAHGFRAMASTLLNELNYRSDLIEKSLAHGDGDKVRAVYNRASYIKERRVMMQEWADYLDDLAIAGTD